MKKEKQAEPVSATPQKKFTIKKELLSYQQQVIAPFKDYLLQQIKTTWFLGYSSHQNTLDYRDALVKLIGECEKQGIGLDFEGMRAPRKQFLLSEVVKQIRIKTIPTVSCCSCNWWGGFFQPEVTAEALENQATEIAKAVKAELDSYHQEKQENKGEVELIAVKSVPEKQAPSERKTTPQQKTEEAKGSAELRDVAIVSVIAGSSDNQASLPRPTMR